MKGGKWGSQYGCLSDEREGKEEIRGEGEKGRQAWNPVHFEEREPLGKQEKRT